MVWPDQWWWGTTCSVTVHSNSYVAISMAVTYLFICFPELEENARSVVDYNKSTLKYYYVSLQPSDWYQWFDPQYENKASWTQVCCTYIFGYNAHAYICMYVAQSYNLIQLAKSYNYSTALVQCLEYSQVVSE